MTSFSESEVEKAALGWSVAHSLDIAEGALQKNAERDSYNQVVFEQRLADAIDSLNPDLPPSALDDAFCKLIRPEGAISETRNRAFHRMLVKRRYPYNVRCRIVGSIHDEPGL